MYINYRRTRQSRSAIIIHGGNAAEGAAQCTHLCNSFHFASRNNTTKFIGTIDLVREQSPLPPPPPPLQKYFRKQWIFVPMLGEIKNIWADFSENTVN